VIGLINKGVFFMSQLSTSPYINFQGKAREAMEFYQKALGGELILLSFNPDGPPKPAGPGDSIMHSMLESDNAVIMGSDGSPDHPCTIGDNIAVALSGEDKDLMSKMFDELSDGGNIKQPLKEEPWGTLGWFEDKFGINWMVNIPKPGA
jgi:PhnB protein